MKILSMVHPLRITFTLSDDENISKICNMDENEYDKFWDEISDVFLSKRNVELFDWSSFKDDHSFSVDIFFDENISVEEQVKIIEKNIALIFLIL